MMMSWLDPWLQFMVEIDNNQDDRDFWLIDMKVFIIGLFDKSIDSMSKFITKKIK